MVPEPRKRVVDSTKVWASLLTNTKYLTGLLTLDYSLKLNGTKYPLVVLYTDSLEPEGLEALDRRGIPRQRIDCLVPSYSKDYINDLRFNDTWSKLQLFGLTEYERIVQLDSDMVVLQNMDELMDVPLDITGDHIFASTHACVCNPMKRAHYPSDWIPANCGFTYQHANPAAAATEGAPPNFGIGMINSGLLVVEPSMDLYNQIIVKLADPTATSGYDFPDQSLLSDVFAGKWVPLSYKYNALKTLRWCHKEIWRDEDVKNIHYILSPKPWEVKESDDETHKWWWDANDQRILEEKETGTPADGW